jgi:hypothetical protein
MWKRRRWETHHQMEIGLSVAGAVAVGDVCRCRWRHRGHDVATEEPKPKIRAHDRASQGETSGSRRGGSAPRARVKPSLGFAEAATMGEKRRFGSRQFTRLGGCGSRAISSCCRPTAFPPSLGFVVAFEISCAESWGRVAWDWATATASDGEV